MLAGVAGVACFTIALLLIPPTRFDIRGESSENSVDAGTAGTALIIGFLLLTVATLVAAAVSMVTRFRRAGGELRQQLWCFALSACFLAGGVAWQLAVAVRSRTRPIRGSPRCRSPSRTSCCRS